MAEHEASRPGRPGRTRPKKAEVLEFEVRLKQARRRAEAEEARLRREVDRAKARLDWAEAWPRRASSRSAKLEAARDRLDDLMFQLDPKYAPLLPVANAVATLIGRPVTSGRACPDTVE